METVFRLKASEIDDKFLAMLKTLFENHDIEITVTEVIKDETEFLLNDPKNKAYLLQAIEEVKQNKNLVRFTGAEFKEYSKSLLKK